MVNFTCKPINKIQCSFPDTYDIQLWLRAAKYSQVFAKCLQCLAFLFLQAVHEKFVRHGKAVLKGGNAM